MKQNINFNKFGELSNKQNKSNIGKLFQTSERMLSRPIWRIAFCALIISGLAIFLFVGSRQTNAQIDDVGENLGTNRAIFTFTNSTPITINDNSTATPYSSDITVGGGIDPSLLDFIIVELNGLSHTFPDDLDIILVGPTGARSILMSDAGGGTDVVNQDLFFNLIIGPPIPDSATINQTFYAPANYETSSDNFPAPGPGDLANEPADLDIFNNTDPTGTWKLFVVDDQGQDMGEISGGWSLNLFVDKVTATVTTDSDDGDGICDATCTLADAIESNANDIVFDPTFFNTQRTITLTQGQIPINRSVFINGPGADLLTISPIAVSRIFEVSGGSNFNISGMTLSGANAPALNGGAIFNHGTTNITNSTIRDNSADNGGAIVNQGTTTITDSTISNNSANQGGGIDNVVGTTTITDSIISNNSANFGGGIFNFGTITIANSTISNNSAQNAGGGIYNNGVTLTLTNSTVSNNSANFGGGIYNFATITITNSTISNNSANQGGGIDNVVGTTTITNSTISSNSAIDGGGIWNQATLNSRNTIIANNTAPSQSDFRGTLTSQGYNLIGNATGVTINGDTTGNQLNVDPRLAPLGDYGGPTKTHALLPGSPAIDAVCDATNAPLTDQRGFLRIDDPNVPSPPGCGSSVFIDMGAFERQPDDFSGGSTRFDLDGDGKTDIGIFRPAPGEWWYLRSADNVARAFQFGQGSDTMVPADYTGDGATDIAFFREGQWFVLRSEDSSFFAFPFGQSGDIPAPGDFDGDGTDDPAVFRPSSGTWFYIRSSDGGTQAVAFGQNGDIPIVEDYDGDGMDDLAVYRPSVSEWFLQRSTAGFIGYSFGSPGNTIPAPADYTGDGTADIAFFNPNAPAGANNWFVLRSDNESFFGFPFGTNGDIPVAGDYDGDGTADPAIYRPTDNSWYLQQSTNGFRQVLFGVANDRPIPAAYAP